MLSDHRTSKRYNIHIIGEFKAFKKPAEPFLGIIDNFSSGGLIFESQNRELNPGDRVEFKFKYPQLEGVVSEIGEIVWKKNTSRLDYLTGIKFREMTSYTESKLLEIMSEIKGEPVTLFQPAAKTGKGTELDHSPDDKNMADDRASEDALPEVIVNETAQEELADTGAIFPPIVDSASDHHEEWDSGEQGFIYRSTDDQPSEDEPSEITAKESAPEEPVDHETKSHPVINQFVNVTAANYISISEFVDLSKEDVSAEVNPGDILTEDLEPEDPADEKPALHAAEEGLSTEFSEHLAADDLTEDSSDDIPEDDYSLERKFFKLGTDDHVAEEKAVKLAAEDREPEEVPEHLTVNNLIEERPDDIPEDDYSLEREFIRLGPDDHVAENIPAELTAEDREPEEVPEHMTVNNFIEERSDDIPEDDYSLEREFIKLGPDDHVAEEKKVEIAALYAASEEPADFREDTVTTDESLSHKRTNEETIPVSSRRIRAYSDTTQKENTRTGHALLFALAVVSLAVVITLALSQNSTDYADNRDGALLSSLAENNGDLDIDKPLAAGEEENEGALDVQGSADSGFQQVVGTAVTTAGSRDNEEIAQLPDAGNFQLLSGTTDQLNNTGAESST